MKERVDAQWNAEWQKPDETRGELTRKFFPSIYHRRKCSFIPDYILTQYLTRHGKFNYYLEWMKIRTDDRCACGEIQTSLHLMEDCVVTADLKHDFIKEMEYALNRTNIGLQDYCLDDGIKIFKKFLYDVHKKSRLRQMQ